MNIIFCDGSCLGNPGPGGWAVLMIEEDQEIIKTGSNQSTTNNRMELTAACEAIKLAKGSCTIYTDSTYLINGITKWLPGWIAKGWRTTTGPVKNKELWEELHSLCNQHTIKWQWIKGHNNHPIHDRVDQMARDAAMSNK